jgi:uncharacterized ferredoxin-like protein
MLQTERITETLKRVAEEMAVAVITAPKGKGVDNLELAILERADILALVGEMRRLGESKNLPGFLRDAKNLEEHVAIALLVGTKIKPLGLAYCGQCGFANCAENTQHNGVCVFNPGDLGIAIGSAVSVAAERHVDNRIMYSMGMAALSLQTLGPEVKIAFGIPLAATRKNPFFDRG